MININIEELFMESEISAEYNKTPLKNLHMTKTKVMLGNTPGILYQWKNENNIVIGKFTTFHWWDGDNISDLYVDPAYRGQGYSYQLLDYATKKLGCKNLAVHKDNIIAKHVYKNYGFVITDQDNDLYYMSLENNINKGNDNMKQNSSK